MGYKIPWGAYAVLSTPGQLSSRGGHVDTDVIIVQALSSEEIGNVSARRDCPQHTPD